MDTSEQYIEMCDCPEIQDAIRDDWRNYQYCKKHECLITHDQDGSAICSEMHRLVYDENELDFNARQKIMGKESCEYSDSWIILPLQDQLQGMSGLGWEQFDDKCFQIADKYLKSQDKEYCADEISKLVSKEQAGIMVVMHELHQKEWVLL